MACQRRRVLQVSEAEAPVCRGFGSTPDSGTIVAYSLAVIWVTVRPESVIRA